MGEWERDGKRPKTEERENKERKEETDRDGTGREEGFTHSAEQEQDRLTCFLSFSYQVRRNGVRCAWRGARRGDSLLRPTRSKEKNGEKGEREARQGEERKG